MTSRRAVLLNAVCMAIGLATGGCGQKGPLTLPETPVTAAPPTEPTTDETNDETRDNDG